jgi:hemerythrin-like metal-binding protein
MIAWDEKLRTGDDRTDSQHKVLIDKLNEFDEIISNSNSGDIRRAAGEVLDFLQFYASWHFAQEEQRMDELHCPAAQENKKEHARFLEMFGKFYTQWQSSSMDLGLARATYQQLADWVKNHIMTVDVQLNASIKSIQISQKNNSITE